MSLGALWHNFYLWKIIVHICFVHQICSVLKCFFFPSKLPHYDLYYFSFLLETAQLYCTLGIKHDRLWYPLSYPQNTKINICPSKIKSVHNRISSHGIPIIFERICTTIIPGYLCTIGFSMDMRKSLPLSEIETGAPDLHWLYSSNYFDYT